MAGRQRRGRGHFHGIRSLREIELLGEAGLSEMEAIKAATINAAKMLNLSDQIGSVDIGKVADLVIVEDNPLDSYETAAGGMFSQFSSRREPNHYLQIFRFQYFPF